MVRREIRRLAVRKFTPHETGGGNCSMTNTTTSHTYTVGRSEGVIYPPDFPTAPTVPQLATLYDQQAQRIAKLEKALHLCAPLTKRAQQARTEALDPDLQ